jgi:hypothetical protein
MGSLMGGLLMKKLFGFAKKADFRLPMSSGFTS